MSDLDHHQLFQDAFHFAAIGMALVGRDGRWLRVNRAICELVGYPEPELLALTFQDITHPDDLALDLAYLDDLAHGRIGQYQMEKRYFRKDGAIIWVLLHVSLASERSGRAEVFISQIQDITARKLAQLELEASMHENIRLLRELQERNRQIEEVRSQFLRVCAWTKQVFFEGEWISLEQFLSTHLHFQVTHAISEKALEEMVRDLPARPAGEEESAPPAS